MPQRAYHGGGHAHSNAKTIPRHTTHRRTRAADYTFVHAGHQIRVKPIAFWIVVGSLAIMAAWSLATGTYFAFHDDVLTRLISRQAQMQFAYEDRIAEMRVRVDRMTSRQVLDQDQFDKKLDLIMRRQAQLESRASSMGTLGDPFVTGSIKPSGRGHRPATEFSMPKPSPISDTGSFTTTPRGRQSRLESYPSAKPTMRLASADPASLPRSAKSAKNPEIERVLDRMQSSLDTIEERQTGTLTALQDRYEAKSRRMRTVLTDLGMTRPPPPERGVGGPFIPAKLPAHAGPFERQLYRVAIARVEMERFNRSLVTVPLRKPVNGELEETSGFGIRLDPFFGRPAMHTGLDFRAPMGDPAHATAAGTVTKAGWAGGYGRLVEVDHGNGLATRYGHLSEIDVKVGEKIKTGQVVGRVGSTGRSTGPHLHYETRIDGTAVDPQKFLRAGSKLGLL